MLTRLVIHAEPNREAIWLKTISKMETANDATAAIIWLSVRLEINRPMAIIAPPYSSEPRMFPKISPQAGTAKNEMINAGISVNRITMA